MDFIYSRDNNDKAYAGKYLRKAEKLFGILNNFDRFPKDYFVADKLMSIYQNYLAITGV